MSSSGRPERGSATSTPWKRSTQSQHLFRFRPITSRLVYTGRVGGSNIRFIRIVKR